MKIKKYASLFHDGSIFSINRSGRDLIISMESAEVDKEDVDSEITLSQDDRIRGNLHIEGVKKIRENNQRDIPRFEMRQEDAEIFRLKVIQNSVEFQLKWGTFPPEPLTEDFSTVLIEAEKIWWENIPELESQF